MTPEDIGNAIDTAQADLEGSQPVEGGQAVEESPFDFPNAWNKETRASIESLLKAPDGRKYADQFRKQWDEHDKVYRSTQAERDRFRAQSERWQQAIQPYEQQYRMMGVDPMNGVQQALAWAQQIQQNPQQTLQQLAQMYGVDFSKAQEDQPYVDPYVKQIESAMAQRLGKIEQAVNGVFGQFNQQAQERELQKIHAFANEQDEQGNLKNAYFNELPIDELVQLVNAGYPLERAYQIACLSNDDIRAKMEQAKAAKDAASRRVRAEKAQGALAAASPAGKAVTGKAKTPKNARDAVEAAFAELQG